MATAQQVHDLLMESFRVKERDQREFGPNVSIIDGPWHQPQRSVLYMQDQFGKRFRIEVKEV